MPEIRQDIIVDEHASAALIRLKARVARRPGRWRRRMTKGLPSSEAAASRAPRRGLAIAA